MLIEVVTEESYADHMQQAFFGPLGMPRTRYGSNTDLIGALDNIVAVIVEAVVRQVCADIDEFVSHQAWLQRKKPG
jgi:CubicO group peptidase (beta-lactamase class C family)